MIRRVRALISENLDWSEMDSERRNAVLLVGAIGIVVFLALVVVAYGYYSDRLASDDETVLVVGERKFKYDFLQRRVISQTSGFGNLTAETFGQIVGFVIGSMEREELLRQAGKERGMTISDTDIEAQMREDLGVREDDSREVLANRLSNELLERDLSLGEYKNLMRAEIVEARLREEYAETIPDELEQADIRLIQVETEAKALEIEQQLEGGEDSDMGALAATESIHSSRNVAGELGWTPRGVLPVELEEPIFAQEAGVIGNIIETKDGFYIALVREKAMREVDEDGRNDIIDASVAALLEETRDHIGSEFKLTEGQVTRLANSLPPASG